MIQSWLISSASLHFAQNAVFLDNVVDVLNEPPERLHDSISSLRQGNTSVIDYYTQLKSFWEEVEHYHPLWQCVCCICKAKEFHLEDYLIRFLTGLNDQFSHVRSQVLLLELLPTLNKTLSMGLRQECQITHVHVHVQEISAMIDSAAGGGRGNPGCGGSRDPAKSAHSVEGLVIG